MTSLVLMDTAAQNRRRLVQTVFGLFGQSNIRGFFLPQLSNTPLVVPDEAVATRAWTHGATTQGRISALGSGAAIAFNGTSDYVTTPDAADLSFGNGVVDGPFTIFAVANVTDTAAARRILSKQNAANLEWQMAVGGTDFLTLTVTDQSVPATPSRVANAVVTAAQWRTYGATYSAATGGATAANDMTLYDNGAVAASTATNAGTYVAMEDLGAAVEIGSDTAHSASFFSGSIAMVLLAAKNLSTAQHAELSSAARRFFRI